MAHHGWLSVTMTTILGRCCFGALEAGDAMRVIEMSVQRKPVFIRLKSTAL